LIVLSISDVSHLFILLSTHDSSLISWSLSYFLIARSFLVCYHVSYLLSQCLMSLKSWFLSPLDFFFYLMMALSFLDCSHFSWLLLYFLIAILIRDSQWCLMLLMSDFFLYSRFFSYSMIALSFLDYFLISCFISHFLDSLVVHNLSHKICFPSSYFISLTSWFITRFEISSNSR